MLTIDRISGALGAEISGVDLSHSLDEGTVGLVRQALLDHMVIFFRDQNLSPEQYLSFAGQFGQAMEYPFVRDLDGHPFITPVIKLATDTINFGGVWHSDTAYLQEPPMGTLLLAREVPDHGGDTLFANMVLAYERLSDGLKRTLDPLHVVNSSAKAAVALTRGPQAEDESGAREGKDFEAVHPVVRTHPETGARSLFVNLAHSIRFEDMTQAESAPLLEYLFRHQVRPEFTCRFRWRPGSIAFWDNRCTLHLPINDYYGLDRVMHRITLAGERPQ